MTFPVTNLLNADDGFLMAVEYSGSVTPTIFRTTWPNPYEVTTWDSWTAWKAGDSSWPTKFRGAYWKPITAVASLAAVQSSNGDGYWQDRANNLVWILVRNGVQQVSAPPNSDADLYRTVNFVLDDSL
jgi:hypothetical protein